MIYSWYCIQEHNNQSHDQSFNRMFGPINFFIEVFVQIFIAEPHHAQQVMVSAETERKYSIELRHDVQTKSVMLTPARISQGSNEIRFFK